MNTSIDNDKAYQVVSGYTVNELKSLGWRFDGSDGYHAYFCRFDHDGNMQMLDLLF